MAYVLSHHLPRPLRSGVDMASTLLHGQFDSCEPAGAEAMTPHTPTPSRSTDIKGWILTKLGLGAGCIFAADWLLYRARPHLSLVLFLILIGVIAVTANRVRANRSARLTAYAVLALTLLPMLDSTTLVSFLLGLFGLSAFTVIMISDGSTSLAQQALQALKLPFCGLAGLVHDGLKVGKVARRGRLSIFSPTHLTVWIVPIALFAVFLGLFSAANPLIENALTQIDLRSAFNIINPARVAFWILILCACWPFIHWREPRSRAHSQPAISNSDIDPDFEMLFGAKAIVRSLILFNLLFAVQTCLDCAFLWGGLSLPDGMSYASYAHRGAYPLVMTALLAAAFVMIAMRPGGPAEQSKLVRPLVLIWTAQNVGLVMSSILRLNLYVAAFSLTGLRVAAFIWMMLVLIGLTLIVVHVVYRKTIGWLVKANGVSLAAVVYMSCFVDFPYLQASYNIAHCAEVSGSGPNLDVAYLVSLGPQVIPALDGLPNGFLARSGIEMRYFRHEVEAARDVPWRSWDFRAWRLQRYLSENVSNDF